MRTHARHVVSGSTIRGHSSPRTRTLFAPIHPKAMPVILRNEAEFEGWLTTPADVALALQRPLPDDEVMIVATGERQDDAA